MQVHIKHQTRYQYMDTVFLEPHTLRLLPRQDKHVHVVSRALQINPQPAGINEILENDGTASLFTWFCGTTNVFELEMETVVQLSEVNPFNFLIYPSSCLGLPVTYPSEWIAVLAPYLYYENEIPEVKKFAYDLAESCGFETVSFLMSLCATVYESFQYEHRERGAAHTSVETLERRRGSCRDFVVLAMEACRYLGLATRYVSGYYVSDDEDEPGELHAWMEVFLPGVGWKGFDPSHGIACAHYHIALSASADPLLTLPVSGTFRGFASSRMTASVSFQLIA